MPGIYVREISWIDWMQQRQSPVLTIPGSYWLCHKHNIYKFIFRYQRTTRKEEHFTFGKELMKIIRRIIKYPPRQGQQFSTNHLLVTYDHTSWTRQDKIFAMTKFKERSATAFSHAFVLTIKLISPLESSEQNIKCDKTSCSDESLLWNDKDSVNSINNDLPEHSEQCDNKQEKLKESRNKDVQLNDNLAVNNLTKTSMNKELTKQITCSKDINKIQSSLISNELSENIKVNNIENSNKHLQHTNKKLKEENSCTISDKYSLVFTETNRSMSSELENLNCLKQNAIKNKDYNSELYVVNGSIMKNSISVVTNSVIDSANADSTSLPYQYLIEKEIEDAKVNIFNSEVSSHNSKKRKREEVIEEYSVPSIDLDTGISETEDSDSIAKRKRRSYNMTPRSSDITDLVMEGLMFTIRQGQDTVAVIEQKTKLEVDEVLENSEKIETKRGEKCLRNSSLLGLENLITMIELPKNTEVEQKCKNVIIQENISECQSAKFTNTYLDKASNITNNHQHTEKHKKDMSKNLKFEEEKEEEIEEEDILPEALQDNLFQSSEKKSKYKEAIINKDLLMDDLDTDSTTKFEPTTENDLFLNEKHEVEHENMINEPKKCKSNVPIIISNEIIATDQIPLPLQKILRNKLLTSHTSVSNTSKTEGNQDLNYNVSEDIHFFGCSTTSIRNNSKICNENKLQEEQKRLDTIEKRLEAKEDKLNKCSVGTSKAGQSSSCEIQDVTQQFHEDLLYLQKKKNEQHLNLRSSKKTENMNQKPNTRETHIEMIKLFHDITKGAKVVVRRMSTKRIHSLIAKSSSLPTTMQ